MPADKIRFFSSNKSSNKNYNTITKYSMIDLICDVNCCAGAALLQHLLICISDVSAPSDISSP